MTDGNTFHRDADCPAHDSRCTAALCIMQKEHPEHAAYLKWAKPMGVVGAPAGPKRQVGNWVQETAVMWHRAEAEDDSVLITRSGNLVIGCAGTYDEGGGFTLPIAILRELLTSRGFRLER